MLVLGVSSVDKNPAKETVARSARVQCEIGTLGEVVGTTDTGINGGQPCFQELSCLICKPHIVLSTLVLAQVSVIGAVSKPDRGAVGELKALIAFVVGSNAMQHSQQRDDVVVQQFPVCLTGDQHLDTGKKQAQKDCFYSYEPGLSAPTCAAVAHIPMGVFQCLLLLFVWFRDRQGDLTWHSGSDPPPALP